MAAVNPGTVEQESIAELEQHFEQTLISMENLDRTSPEIWPEKTVPGMTNFINNYSASTNNKLPYSKEFTQEDNDYLHQLASLTTAGLISKVKELHDIAYQLGLEESKEMTRGKYLNLFKTKSNNK